LVTGYWSLAAGSLFLVTGSSYQLMLDAGFSILGSAILQFSLLCFIENRTSNIEYQFVSATSSQEPGTSVQRQATSNRDVKK
jgi:hypothetical protein